LQRHLLHTQRTNLLPRQLLLLLMDFTSFSLDNKIGEGPVRYVQDLVIVLEFINEGKTQLEYIDFICDDADTNANDYYFVLHAMQLLWKYFLIREAFDGIDVWSDGGPHHFKTKWCQWMWHVLSTQFFDGKLIAHNFFASYHGHSLADAHASVAKRALRAAYNISEHQRKHTGDVAFGPASAEELITLLRGKATRTHAFHLRRIPRDIRLKPNIAPLNLIKSKHRFVYEDGQCLDFEHADKPEGKSFSFRQLG
jgi:hypothetical protein